MADTPRLVLPLIADGQSSAYIPHNQALSFLDAFVGMNVKDFALDTPPGSPADGDCYVIGSSPTGAWTGQANKITVYAAGWYFFTPKEGLVIWVADEDTFAFYDGTEWIDHPTGRGDYRTFFVTDEFGQSTSFTSGVTRFTNGTGASSAAYEPDSTVGMNRIGLTQFNTGTSTTGRSGLSGAQPRLYMGQGKVEMEWDIYIPVISTGSERFSIVVGFADGNTTDLPTNHVLIRYRDDINGGAWHLSTSDNGVTGITNGSGATVAAGWYRLKLVVNEAGTSFEAFVNGTSIGVRTANIPTASTRAVDYFTGIFKSAGTTDRAYVIDRFWTRFRRSTPL
jgi:hypothetical protein